MILLDENLPDSQRRLLRSWRIPARQIGLDAGKAGMKDPAIVSFLHRCRSATFFTRDSDYYDRRLCHDRYSLVYLAVEKTEAASFVRRVLRHPALRTWARRRGKALHVTHAGIRIWELHRDREELVSWSI